MCGLSGEINHDGRPVDADALQRMTEALAPRGPDGAGIVLRGSVGLGHRRLKICGSKGTIELSPLERFDGKPLQMEMTLSEGNDAYPAGTHLVDFGVRLDRYEDQLLEFAKLIRGEMENPYTREHDYQVQEVVLAASGYEP